MTLFSNYIQAGRLAVGRFGDLIDKPCVIADIVSLTRVIVVVPGEGRMMVPIRRLVMTSHRLDIPRGASIADVEEALKADDVIAQWKESSAAKSIRAHQLKKSLSDFDRFRVVRAKKYIARA